MFVSGGGIKESFLVFGEEKIFRRKGRRQGGGIKKIRVSGCAGKSSVGVSQSGLEPEMGGTQGEMQLAL